MDFSDSNAKDNEGKAPLHKAAEEVENPHSSVIIRNESRCPRQK